jgi:hypothetical protein
MSNAEAFDGIAGSQRKVGLDICFNRNRIGLAEALA